MKTKIRFSRFIPTIVTFVCAVITMILYAALIKGNSMIDYMAMIPTAFLPLLLLLYPAIFKKELPMCIGIAVSLNIILACYVGTALKFYIRWWWWDLFVHGYFGFICCGAAFYLLSDSPHITLKPIFVLLLSFAVMLCFSAIWEIIEYVFDLILHGDTQKVEESVAAGKSAVADTIEDMMIAFAGGLLFFAVTAIDYATKHTLFYKLGLLSPETAEKPEN